LPGAGWRLDLIGRDHHIRGMSKIQFLRDQYFDMLASGQHVCDRWQTSFQNFVDDLEHATPTNPGRRYLSLKAKDLGFTPENVEWHFHSTVKVRSRSEKAVEMARDQAKDGRRKMIAEQYRQWEVKMAQRKK
jgi:hypothetical protein